jgi:hypothetical protein
MSWRWRGISGRAVIRTIADITATLIWGFAAVDQVGDRETVLDDS